MTTDNITNAGPYISDQINQKLSKAFDHKLNVLLSGIHGTSKTSRVLQVAREKGVAVQYYSCSTLDPFTDLVGIPTPRKYCREDKVWFATEKHNCPGCNSELYGEDSPVVESLKMVRPVDIDEAVLIFFDELNRAESKVTNAVMEIIQFGSINGEKLAHLDCCWAAINPPNNENEYDVESLDPALADRFDIFIQLEPEASKEYLVSRFEGKTKNHTDFADALVEWYEDHSKGKGNKSKETYISPRRLEKLGHLFLAMGNCRDGIAPWLGKIEATKLNMLLKAAKDGNRNKSDVLDGRGQNKKRFKNSDQKIEKLIADNLSEVINERPDLKIAELRKPARKELFQESIEYAIQNKDSGDNMDYLKRFVSTISATNSEIMTRDFMDDYIVKFVDVIDLWENQINDLNKHRKEIVVNQAIDDIANYDGDISDPQYTMNELFSKVPLDA